MSSPAFLADASVRLTIWLAMAAYFVVVLRLILLRGPSANGPVANGPIASGWPRVVWSLGCLFLLLHFAAAFISCTTGGMRRR